MFARFPKNWAKGIVSGVVGISLLGGSAFAVEAHTTTHPQPVTTPAATQPAAKPPVTKPVISPETAQLFPAEPAHEEQCGFCKMKVYSQTEDLGQFTAQVVTHDGKHIFLDDIGCMMNFKRDQKEQNKPVKAIWVRDYFTKEWILASKAVLVSAAIDTPMRYGYVMFKDEASATKFINENKAKNAAKTTWQVIEADSKARAEKRKAKMNQGDTTNQGNTTHQDTNHTTTTNHH